MKTKSGPRRVNRRGPENIDRNKGGDDQRFALVIVTNPRVVCYGTALRAIKARRSARRRARRR